MARPAPRHLWFVALAVAAEGGPWGLADARRRRTAEEVSATGCPYEPEEPCAQPQMRTFLDAWREKTRCWLCDNGSIVKDGSVLIGQMSGLGITGDLQITREWLGTCLPGYVLALFATTRSKTLQSWRFYDFGLKILRACQFDDGRFFDHYGVTATQLDYVFFLLSYDVPLPSHSLQIQAPERERELAAVDSTAIVPSPTWMLPLVFDVGMGLGADTRYYLSQGFRVVSVEANPRAVQTAVSDSWTQKFLRSGQLSFLHAAIAPPGRGGGSTSFFALPHRPEQSNVEPWLQAEGGAHIKVRTIECADLLRIYGRAAYLKIDIEANSVHCLESLHRANLEKSDSLLQMPWHISLEVESMSMVTLFQEMLAGLGYGGYKVCRQYIYSPAPCEQGQYGSEVPGCGSGPFGEAAVDYIAGVRWRPMAELGNDTNFAEEFVGGLDWFDLHARWGDA